MPLIDSQHLFLLFIFILLSDGFARKSGFLHFTEKSKNAECCTVRFALFTDSARL